MAKKGKGSIINIASDLAILADKEYIQVKILWKLY